MKNALTRDRLLARKSTSILLIIVMFFTVFAVPLSSDDNIVNANTKTVSAPGDTITVTLDYAGGSGAVAAFTVSEGSVYEYLPTATRTGYNFLGWYSANNVQIKNGTPVDPTITVLTAKWQGKKYTVKFNKNKGKLSKKSKKVTFGSKYAKLPTPKRSGYKFAGWYTAKKGGTKVTKNSIVNKAKTHTIYARWGKTTKVSFNANGGKVSKKSKKVTQYKKYGSLPTPKRSGYTFVGWYTKKSGGKLITKDSILNKKKNSTLYARWGKPITVSFDADGGELSVKSKKVSPSGTYGELPTPRKTAYTGGNYRPSYTFLGWYTKPGGEGVRVYANTKVVSSKSHTLYAKWSRVAI